jgi:hypothetical protein
LADIPTSADPSLLQSLKLHLEGLKRTPHGLILYNQIQRGLQQYGHKDGRIEHVFVTFLHVLLGKYAKSPACDPATRVKARLIQQRLTLYLPTPPPRFNLRRRKNLSFAKRRRLLRLSKPGRSRRSKPRPPPLRNLPHLRRRKSRLPGK